MNITQTQAHHGMAAALGLIVSPRTADSGTTIPASGTGGASGAVGSAGSGSSTDSAAASAANSAASALGASDFLTLLVTQLQNQDPTQPTNPTDFVTQLAQFSEVSGIQSLQTSFSGLAQSLSGNQTLQAASLVGHGVMAPGSTAALSGGAMYGAVTLPSAASDVKVQISNASGTAVATLDLGAQNAGSIPFQWNGSNGAGQTMPDGTYSISAIYQVNGGAPQAATTQVAGLVQSVSLGANGQSPMLNVQGLGSVPLSDVTEIM